MAPGTWWGGAASGFLVGGILTSPMPLVVSVWGVPGSWRSPLLGQQWVELLSAVWIDVNKGSVEVTFDDEAAEIRKAEHPGAWVEVPWIETEPGERMIEVAFGGRVYRSQLDTGSSNEFLLIEAPPAFLARPGAQRQRTMTTMGFRTLRSAIVPVAIEIGAKQTDGVQLSWFERAEDFPIDDTRIEAVIGLPFLARGPVLLDVRHDRVVFFFDTD